MLAVIAVLLLTSVSSVFAFNDLSAKDSCVYLTPDNKQGAEKGIQFCGTIWPHESTEYNYQSSMRSLIAMNAVSLMGYRFTYETTDMKPVAGVYTEYWESEWNESDEGRRPVTTVYCYGQNYGKKQNWMRVVKENEPSVTYAKQITELVQACLDEK